MAYKNLGPGVSQLPQEEVLGDQFSGEEKAFESVIIQAGKPVIDWEMNLRNEVSSDHGVRLSNQRMCPSGWINGNFLENPSLANSYAEFPPVPGNENTFGINTDNLLVNGWNVRFQYSDAVAPPYNRITLPGPPKVGYEINLVILEVWRALVLAVPSVANKSSTGLIFRNGNVKAPDAVNFTDDLIDPTEAIETAARVQIQYRYRVIQNVDINTYPDGLDDPTVFANTVSDFTGPGADGTPTALTYGPVSGDAGLWVAGGGTAADAATLGTVDGFMYAIPICAVFRRCSNPFDRVMNPNGGALIAAGMSDRPDLLFSDQIKLDDIKDLRKGIARDHGEILQKVTQQVFNNSLATEHEIYPMPGSPIGVGGTAFTISNDITRTDYIRRHFSGRTITETIVCKVDIPFPGSPIAVFNLSSLTVPWSLAIINLLTITGVNIVAVNNVRIVDSIAPSDKDGLDSVSPMVSTVLFVTSIVGIDTAVILFDVPIGTVNPVTVYAELAIEYPAIDPVANIVSGLSRNVVDSYAAWTPDPALLAMTDPWIDVTKFAATSDATRFSLDPTLWSINKPHREAALVFLTTLQSVALVSPDGSHLYLWERLTGDPITLGPPFGAPTTNYTYNTAYTTITLPGPVAPGTVIVVSYFAYRPLPSTGPLPADSYQIFYKTRAIQSLLPGNGNQTLFLIPRSNPDNIYIITGGAGSPDDSFPFESPSAQVPVGLLPSAIFPESVLDNPNPVSIIGFGVNTGFIKLDAKVPYFPDPNAVTLYKSAPDVVSDGDGRRFWPKSDAGVATVYSPVVFGHLLTAKQRHKVTAPVLMELTADVPEIGRKGTTVLVILTNWLEFDDQNTIQLSSILGSSCAAIYRVRGHLINSQRPVL